MSDDGAHGLTIIAFIGSVFSPYYAGTRRRAPFGAADPLDHCALNVVLYGKAGGRWAMTERGRQHVHRTPRSLQIGPSALRWEGDTLRIDIDEVTAPWPSRLRGVVRVHAPQRYDHPVALAPRHRWCAIAPSARVDVDLGTVRWEGPAYLDSNQGDEPLERAFRRWDWSRALSSAGHGLVMYDLERIDATPLQIGLRFQAGGAVETIDAPPSRRLPGTRWGLERHARSDAGTSATLVKTLTDAPFYARSVLNAQWHGERVTAMHESLSLRRFDNPWVQSLLPFRMPRDLRRAPRALADARPGPH